MSDFNVSKAGPPFYRAGGRLSARLGSATPDSGTTRGNVSSPARVHLDANGTRISVGRVLKAGAHAAPVGNTPTTL